MYVWVVTIILEGCNLFIFSPSQSLHPCSAKDLLAVNFWLSVPDIDE
jgi:hypothetical protein